MKERKGVKETRLIFEDLVILKYIFIFFTNYS
jgi:hypothetical protein